VFLAAIVGYLIKSIPKTNAQRMGKFHEAFLFHAVDLNFSVWSLGRHVVGKWYYSGDGVLRLQVLNPTIFLPAL